MYTRGVWMLHRPPPVTAWRVRTARPPSMLLVMMVVLQEIFPLDLCTPSTCHSAGTSARIITTSWMQQRGVYRRQKASRLIVSGELVALYSLAQHRCRSTPCHCVTFQVVKNGTYGAPQLVWVCY